MWSSLLSRWMHSMADWRQCFRRESIIETVSTRVDSLLVDQYSCFDDRVFEYPGKIFHVHLFFLGILWRLFSIEDYCEQIERKMKILQIHRSLFFIAIGMHFSFDLFLVQIPFAPRCVNATWRLSITFVFFLIASIGSTFLDFFGQANYLFLWLVYVEQWRLYVILLKWWFSVSANCVK